MAPRNLALPSRRPAGAQRAANHLTDDLPAQDAYRSGYVLASLLASAAGVALVMMWTASLSVLDAVEAVTGWLRGHNDLAAHLVATVLLGATSALAFAAAWGRATAPTRPVRVAGGRGTIPVTQIAVSLRDAIEARGDVRQATVAVEHHGRGVRVTARIAVTPDARLADTARGCRTTIEDVLTTQVGVPLTAAPAIELRYEELRLHPRAHSDMQEPDD